jgi:hypothetical protein
MILMSSPSPAVSFTSVAGAISAATPAPTRPREELGTAKLKAAFVATKTMAVVFNAELGPSVVPNRTTLKVAGEPPGDASESIQIVTDLLSCADNLDYLGQTFSHKINKRTHRSLSLCPTALRPPSKICLTTAIGSTLSAL